jgi:glycine betaine/proline transport system substrate-binding protein
LFATADTSPKGRFLDFTPGWDYRNEERLEALGVDFEVVYSGSEAASFAELDAAHKRGEPILLVVWTPHWAIVKYDLVPIELPVHSDCYPVTEKFDCGYHIDDVTKLTWSGLEEDMPKAYEFLENFQITNDQQTTMVIEKTDYSKTDAEAARAWKDANEDIWKTWIP